MTIIPVIIIIIILALVIVYVTRPLFTVQDEADGSATIDTSQRLLAEYNAVLERIRELDFDFNMGKLTAPEYNSQRDEHLTRASSLRRQLNAEEIDPGSTSS